MAQSLTQLYVHIIFHTKSNHSIIRPIDSPKLYAYIHGIVSRNKCYPILINGVSNHIHILCILSKNIAFSKLVQEIKQSSSHWLKSVDSSYRYFEWQRGYGGFSVSPSILNKTKEYIKRQEEHHMKRSFQEEYLLFLKEYGIDYDEHFLWSD